MPEPKQETVQKKRLKRQMLREHGVRPELKFTVQEAAPEKGTSNQTAEAGVSAVSRSPEKATEQAAPSNAEQRQTRQRERLHFSEEERSAEPVAAEPISSKAGEKPGAKPGRKRKSRLRFAKEELPAAATLVARSGEAVIHRKVSEAEQDNSAVEAAHKTEIAAEIGVRLAKRPRSKLKEQKSEPSRVFRHEQGEQRDSRLRFHSSVDKTGNSKVNEQEQTKSARKERIRKQRRKRQVTDAHRSAQTFAALTGHAQDAGRRTLDFVSEHKRGILRMIALLLVVLLILAQFAACGTIFMAGAEGVVSTSWQSADEDIQGADLYYTQLEAALQQRLNTVEQEYPGYDEYCYNVSEIGHSPVELISYLSVLKEGGIFTYDSALQSTLDALFSEQYAFSVETFAEERTTTRTVHVGESLGTVVTSAYCACEICCGRWAGGPTASGVYPQANHTLAVDAYNPTLPLGTEVIINGTLYKVEDTGNFARFGVDFDVFMGSHQEALNWGHKSFEAYLAGGENGEAIEVTTTEEVTVCSVTLRQTPFAQIVADRLTDEQYEQYQIYTESRGNRPFLATPVPYDWTASVAGLYGDRCSGTEISMHDGLDLAMPAGTEIYSAIDGTVSEVSGTGVTIQNDRGYEVRYDHCGSVSVSAGQAVGKGDTIGQVGSSVLHLELRHDGTDYNPYFYFETGTGYAIGGGAVTLGGGSPAMGDATFQSMLRIAERQLGTPYVWGGSSPGGFDCSGFVSYVLTQSGVRNVGRTTAQGLYNLCSHVSMSEARPGDLIFFTGTYSSSNPVTHVGIYVGNGQMIHAGDPVKYSSINSSYWQSHYYGMGRPR